MNDEHLEAISPIVWGKTTGKKWDHLAIRPDTFKRIRTLKRDRFKSDDAFIKELLNIYEKRLAFLLEKKRQGEN